MPQDPVQLDYAPPPAGARRASARQWLYVALGVLAVWVAAAWGPETAARLQVSRAQSRCATFEYPPDTVVYDNSPAAREQLLADAENYVALDDTNVWPARAVARREPDAWASLKSMLFGTRSFWPPGPAAPKAMVHLLRNARGDERLVAVIVAPAVPGRPVGARGTAGASPAVPELGLVAALIRPGDWDNPPRWDGNGTFLRANFDPARRVRFYSAKLDPTNPARFSLRYEIDGQGGVVDGVFQMDGDVVMTVRNGPAKVARGSGNP